MFLYPDGEEFRVIISVVNLMINVNIMVNMMINISIMVCLMINMNLIVISMINMVNLCGTVSMNFCPH